MSDFDPGEGWREVPVGGVQRPYIAYYPDSETGRYWVPEEPVPPLPTEPYTVIRVTWRNRNAEPTDVLTLSEAGVWTMPNRVPIYNAQQVANSITGFEVLAEPRAVTAKAVLDAVARRALEGDLGDLSDAVDETAREFKVDQ